MDSGECINVDAISHPERRRFLQAVFSHPSMPARHYSGSGWAKAEGCGCIRRAVLQSLLENGDVIHPQELSQVQARAVRMAPILQDLLKQIPELVTELGQLLAMLSSGETVDLSEMENKEVKKALSRCLNEIGVEQPENCGKYSFCLPELDEAVMRGALQCNAEVLIAMKDYEQDWSTAGQVRPEREDGIIKSAPSAQPTGAEQSDKASSDASESEDE